MPKEEKATPQRSIFRIHGDFWLKRHPDGSVTLLLYNQRQMEDKKQPAKDREIPEDWTFNRYGQPVPEGIWCSAVCNASALGEGFGRYYQAESFHRGQELPPAQKDTPFIKPPASPPPAPGGSSDKGKAN